jgi:hypothetical protein
VASGKLVHTFVIQHMNVPPRRGVLKDPGKSPKRGVLKKSGFWQNSYLFFGKFIHFQEYAWAKDRPKRGFLPTNSWVWGPNSRFYWS